MLESDGLNMLPRPGEPESTLEPGMSAPTPGLGVTLPAPAIIRPLAIGPFPNVPNMPDTSMPGGNGVAIEAPPGWFFDFDPGTGSARATFNGEVQFVSGGAAGTVASFNGRTGAVTLLPADITGANGVLNNNGVLTNPTITNATMLSGMAVSGVATLSGGATISSQCNITGDASGSNAPTGDVGEFFSNTLGNISLASATWQSIGGFAANLTAGDWDVWGSVTFGGTALCSLQTGGLTTNFASPATGLIVGSVWTLSVSSAILGGCGFTVGPVRFSIAAATGIYLAAEATFPSGTATAGGVIFARRRR